MSKICQTRCAPGCKIDQVGNGACNPSCNNTMCDHDGGDCVGSSIAPSGAAGTQPTDSDGSWMASLANTNGVFSHLYGVAKRWDPSHVPFALDKNIMADFAAKFSPLHRGSRF